MTSYFFVKLKDVDTNVSLEREIIEQHDLEAEEDQIKSILRHGKPLIIFGGYDEYKKGTNSAIDAAISGKRGNSFVLITSRPDHMEKKDKNKLDLGILLKGFNDGCIKECSRRYLCDKNKSEALINPSCADGNYSLSLVPANTTALFI